MTMRWTGSDAVVIGPPRYTSGDHVVRPFYREPGLIVRWWLCSCGQSIVRVRPRPYPPRHA